MSTLPLFLWFQREGKGRVEGKEWEGRGERGTGKGYIFQWVPKTTVCYSRNECLASFLDVGLKNMIEHTSYRAGSCSDGLLGCYTVLK